MTERTHHDSPKTDEHGGEAAADEAADEAVDEAETEGQDREDNQDRESHVVDEQHDADVPAPVVHLLDIAFDAEARRAKVVADAPYRAEGFNVYDGRGRRVAICGTDDNRAASGPGLALSIAEVLNRVAGGH